MCLKSQKNIVGDTQLHKGEEMSFLSLVFGTVSLPSLLASIPGLIFDFWPPVQAFLPSQHTDTFAPFILYLLSAYYFSYLLLCNQPSPNLAL